jgi:hypothetical protein
MHWGFLLWAQTLSSSGWKETGYSHRQLRCGWIAAAHAAVDFQALGARPACLTSGPACVFRRIVTADFGIVTAHFGHRDRAFISAHRDRPFRDRDRPFRRS